MAEPTVTGEDSHEQPPGSTASPRGKSAATRVDDGDRTEHTLNDSPVHDARTSVIEASEAIARELAERQNSGQASPDHSTIVQIVQGVLKSSSNARMRVRPPSPDRIVAGYEIISELGRGAAGVVYRARQIGLNRTVALKMILAGGHASPATLERFRAEAAAVASLQHGNIVQIYEIGDHGGLPFFSLEYCAAGSLADRLKGTPIPASTAARISVKLARAMHYAHGSNVVHRDLKPGNILLHPRDDAGRTTVEERGDSHFDFDAVIYKITDFGLAKRLDEVSQTKTGAVLGTPSYMAPEQALGRIHEVGPPADIYALGAILYEFLTGRPPFRAAAPLDTVVQVINDEPVAPTRLQSGVPADLETIALKCLQKDPAKRYETAAALADDLQRFLDGKPIIARPVSRGERAWRWCERNPVVAALSALAVVLLLVGTAVSTYFARQSGIRARMAEQNELSARHNLYVAQMNLVQRAWDDVEMTRVRDLLASQIPKSPEQPDFRGPEWHYWDRLAHRELAVLAGHAGGTTCLAFSPDGRRIASGGRDKLIRIWDLATGAEIVQLAGHSDGIAGLAFLSRDRLISAATVLKAGDKGPYVDGGEVRIWDLAHSKSVVEHPVPSDSEIKALAVSRNGEWAAVACQDGAVHVMRTDDCSNCRTMVGKRAAAMDVALSPSGDMLAAAFDDGTLSLWNLPDGSQAQLPGQLDMIPWSLAFAPDGRRLAVGGAQLESGDRQFRRQGELRVIEVSTGRILARSKGHAGPVLHVEFSPDGHRLVSASHDRTVRIWDALTGRHQLTLQGHEQLATAASFSRDARLVASGSLDGSIRIWEPNDNALSVDVTNPTVCGPVVSPDGHAIALCRSVTTVNERPEQQLSIIQLLSTDMRRPVASWQVRASSVKMTLLAANSRFDVAAVCVQAHSSACRLQAWKIGSNSPVIDKPLPFRDVTCAFTDSTGARWMLCSADRLLQIATETGEVEQDWSLPAPVADLRFVSADDWRAVCIDSNSRAAMIWTSRGQTMAIENSAGLVKSAAISRDGSLVALGCTDGTVRICETATGHAIVPPMTGHLWTVGAVAFNSDGTRVASAGTGFDGTVRLWDTRTGQELLVRDGGPALEPIVTFGPNDCCLMVQMTNLALHDLRRRRPTEQIDSTALNSAQFHMNQPMDRSVQLAALRVDCSIDHETRVEALKLADKWPDDPARFGRAAWQVLRSPFESAESYRQAQSWAERYSRESPQASERLVYSSLARVRLGEPAEAVRPLTRFVGELSGVWFTRGRAVLAIALQRTGQHDKAAEMLQLVADRGNDDELVAEALYEVRTAVK